VLDAAVSTETGLGIKIEETTEQLGDEWIGFDKLIRNFSVGVRYAEKEVDGMLQAINDQTANLMSANEDLVNSASEIIAVQARDVFGEHFTGAMVKEHKQLFMDLAKGGEIAEAAWKSLSKISFNKILEGITDQDIKDKFSELYN
jgi:hypothetical protein